MTAPASSSDSGSQALLAEFRTAYFDNPPSPLAIAYNKALQITDTDRRQAAVEAVLQQFGYSSLTDSDVDSIINPRDGPNSPPPSRPTSPTPTSPASDPNAPPATTPDTTNAGSWIFPSYAGSYNVTSDGFLASTTAVVVRYDGSLDLGSTPPTKLKSTVVVDDQHIFWVRWDVKAGTEWYLVRFSQHFNTTLNSTVRELIGFHCVVAAGSPQANTPVSAECPQIKVSTSSTTTTSINNPYVIAGLSLLGLVILRSVVKSIKEGHEGGKTPAQVLKEQKRYQERAKVVKGIAKQGQAQAAEDSLKLSDPAERQMLHTDMQFAIKKVVDNYFAKPANASQDPGSAATTEALKGLCETQVSGVLKDWCSDITRSHPSGLDNHVLSYLDTADLIDAKELAEIKVNVSNEAVKQVMEAFNRITGATGHTNTGFNTVVGKYLQLNLVTRQLNSIQAKLVANGQSLKDAATALATAKEQLVEKNQKAEQVAQQLSNKENENETALKAELETANEDVKKAKDAVKEKITAQDNAEKETAALQGQKEESEKKRSELTDDTNDLNKKTSERLDGKP
ncbi:hypothetical protein AK830_g5115 [Neonectria ditissima]|uniref:Uncharacterized protein n=1 Tax=Neonectria ditissima TaxID=78410 RepID=A0A0N8H7C9_9HYPO|nr:hypothetical protein AK830_g5115 [Neonectria ditissima]